MLALDATLVASGLLVRSQHLLVRSLRERAREAEEGHRLRVEEARHTERERIAREMHDVLAHRISLLAVHAGALEVRRSAPEEERQAATVVRQYAYEALEDLREVIGMLRDGERAVAVLVGQGQTNSEIGRELLMSTATVKAYMSRILTKLDLNNRVQVALLVHDAG